MKLRKRLKITEIKKVRSIKARMHGNQTFVDIIIVTDQTLSVFESHQITEEIENSLLVKNMISKMFIFILSQSGIYGHELNKIHPQSYV
ncbi:cation transporter dimerization domain-containing protein [Alkalihalobacillus deserti]|uniref:cation transporter dimerization domain-containing protein n=1 Tax=Alkalihalobacillus deserti TaxID=2879466 RepID=UPI001D13854D